ncbi:hypothetical protein ACEYYB_06205 [Paracoccus sp. p4-l81]|uniref:hypothetical protein n=1 Tax=unclassified Paracoccus (in: a-proteobacteria) TaxID=2688777 RepID=UPI0035BA7732
MAAPRVHWLTRLLGNGTPPSRVARSQDAPSRLWLHIGDDAAVSPARRIARRLLAPATAPQVILSVAAGVDPALLPEAGADDPLAQALPLVDPAAMRQPGWAEDALNRDPPDLGVLIGAHPDLALAAAARAAGVAVMAVEARFDPPQGLAWPWQRAARRDQIRSFCRILLADRLSARVLRRLDVPGALFDVTGPIADVTDPLPCAETERAAMAQILSGRPMWAAIDLPDSEIEPVIVAQNAALRLAHRLLLILIPAEGSDIDALADRLAAAGLSVARRDLDEDPQDDDQVLLATDRSELGLWYRLAPVTLMGGTLTPDAVGRSPMEPAALGSAIIHGPATDRAPDDYRRLDTGRATRAIAGPADLPDALAELIAPDRAAELAHAAWAVTSGGAAVADVVAQDILTELATARQARGG